MDNDCDGETDEDFPAKPTTCGVGECAGNTGETQCVAGEVEDTCDPFAGAVDEICNGLDDDCDSAIDDGDDTDNDGIQDTCDNCPMDHNPPQKDRDEDSVGDDCDNCIELANPSQADDDDDTIGNACDNCQQLPNVDQDNSDTDGLGDACDNCPLAFNPGQSNGDEDADGDACDLDDGCIYLVFTDNESLEWQETGFDEWNVYRGDRDTLIDQGLYTQAPGSNLLASRECGLPMGLFVDNEIPEPGEVAFYLVTGMSGGTESSLRGCYGPERPNDNPCP
jgi:hypothetical protein